MHTQRQIQPLYQISCDREDIGMDDRLADLKMTAFDELTFE